MKNEIMDLMEIVVSIILVILISALVLLPVYYSSCQKAKVFNKINQTEYTCSDFFWAKDQINSNTQTIKLQ